MDIINNPDGSELLVTNFGRGIPAKSVAGSTGTLTNA